MRACVAKESAAWYQARSSIRERRVALVWDGVVEEARV